MKLFDAITVARKVLAGEGVEKAEAKEAYDVLAKFHPSADSVYIPTMPVHDLETAYFCVRRFE